MNQALVKNLGGLYIIGTERHESRRIDNQLRGRCGRQGDPGTSRFFLSLDDNLLKLFGGPNLQKFMQNQLLDESPLESELLTKSLDSAQKKVEEIHYDSRRYLFDYDEVLSNQRNVVFYERRKILESISVKDRVLAFGEQVIADLVEELNILNIQTINQLLSSLVGNNLKLNLFSTIRNDLSKLELQTYLFQEFWLSYEAREAELQVHEIGVIRDIERNLLLVYNDIAWKEHLQKMSLLRDAVGWRSYGQRNPLYEYKDEAYALFQNLNKITRQLVIFDLFRTRLL
jgi:preprotein translocase subunit SecA